jgi:hypothetical protein
MARGSAPLMFRSTTARARWPKVRADARTSKRRDALYRDNGDELGTPDHLARRVKAAFGMRATEHEQRSNGRDDD